MRGHTELVLRCMRVCKLSMLPCTKDYYGSRLWRVCACTRACHACRYIYLYTWVAPPGLDLTCLLPMSWQQCLKTGVWVACGGLQGHERLPQPRHQLWHTAATAALGAWHSARLLDCGMSVTSAMPMYHHDVSSVMWIVYLLRDVHLAVRLPYICIRLIICLEPQ